MRDGEDGIDGMHEPRRAHGVSLTEGDMVFLGRQESWRWGPTFDLRLWRRAAGDSLVEALRADEMILWGALASLPWVRARSDEFGQQLCVWCPPGMAAIGLCVDLRDDAARERSIWLYPPHLERANGRPFLAPGDGRDPRVFRFLSACIDLVRRLHARCPLRSAVISDEVQWHDPVEGRLFVWPPLRGSERDALGWSELALAPER